MNKPIVVTLQCIAAATLLAGAGAFAQSYPARPVTFTIPFAPGGGLDNVSRIIAPKLAEGLGQPVIPENRPASAGIVGADYVAKSPPDGYNIIMGGSWLVVSSLLYSKLPYNVESDFTPIALVGDSWLQLLINTAIPPVSLKELVEYSRANPGKLNYGSPGLGHPFHLAMELLKIRTGLDITHIPYKGTAPAIQDFMAGRVHALFSIANAPMQSQIKAGKVRALVTASDTRIAVLPEVPTLNELGVRDLRPAANLGIIGPAKLPRPVVDRLNRELDKATASAEVLAAYDRQNWVRLHSTPDEYAQIVRKELETWGPVVKSLNLRLD